MRAISLAAERQFRRRMYAVELTVMHGRLARMKQGVLSMFQRFLGRVTDSDEMPGVTVALGADMVLLS